MMWVALAAVAPGQSEFSASMNRYVACLSAGLRSDLSSQTVAERSRVYRKAAAQCQREREEAISAAVRERTPGTSAEDAKALAIDIIDTLDPMSSVPRP